MRPRQDDSVDGRQGEEADEEVDDWGEERSQSPPP